MNCVLDTKAAAMQFQSGSVHWPCQRKGVLFCLSWQCLYLTHAGLDIHKLPNCVQIFYFFNFNFFNVPSGAFFFCLCQNIVNCDIVFWMRPIGSFRLLCVCVVSASSSIPWRQQWLIHGQGPHQPQCSRGGAVPTATAWWHWLTMELVTWRNAYNWEKKSKRTFP